ncbi:MAG: hypothetical protein LC679_03000 [Intrasporangiaceae bacterium]|nr:hypothetical protein [Intrasporangiaceae bacterium]
MSEVAPELVPPANGGGYLAVGSTALGTGRSAAAVLLFAIGAASMVALPVVLRLVLGERIVGPLQSARGWLVAYNDAVVVVMVASKGWSAL